MPDIPVGKEDKSLLECGCTIEGALLEMVWVKLGIIGEDVAEAKKANGEKSGWKCLGRPERERLLQVLALFGHDLDDVIMLIQD